MGDIPNISFNYMETPLATRGIHQYDCIMFKWSPQSKLNTANTNVIVEDLSGDWKSLGNLRPIIKLPNVYYAPDAKLIVLLAI